MDYRTDNFLKKFNAAEGCLGVRPHELISLKLRETVGSHSEYRDFLQVFEQQTGLHSFRIAGELQGEGHLIEDGQTKIIFVEHESGLEILYIAGSIASLISLVPMVVHGWRAFRSRGRRRHDFDDGRVEIRRVDEKGQITETPVHDNLGLGFSSIAANAELISAAKTVEGGLARLRQEVAALAKRVEVLEAQSSPSEMTREIVSKKLKRPSKSIIAKSKQLRELIETGDPRTRHKERSRLENDIRNEFAKNFGLSPDVGKLTFRFYYRFINTDCAPREKLFDHIEYFRRGENLVIVSQPYDFDEPELARWAKECGATYSIANEWCYHYPGHASLFFVEFTPGAKDALDKRVRAKGV